MKIPTRSFQRHALAKKLDLIGGSIGVRVGSRVGETLLDTLDLLRDRREDTFLQSIELVETTPCSNSAETDKDTTHGLEVECLVTTEDNDKHAELNTERLDRLSLTRTGGTERRTTELVVESLRQRQVASIVNGV